MERFYMVMTLLLMLMRMSPVKCRYLVDHFTVHNQYVHGNNMTYTSTHILCCDALENVFRLHNISINVWFMLAVQQG